MSSDKKAVGTHIDRSCQCVSPVSGELNNLFIVTRSAKLELDGTVVKVLASKGK